jgi:hypothetical protein
MSFPYLSEPGIKVVLSEIIGGNAIDAIYVKM